MNCEDAQLQKCYDGQLAAAGETSEELRQVRALIATHDMFQMFGGLTPQKSTKRLSASSPRKCARRCAAGINAPEPGRIAQRWK